MIDSLLPEGFAARKRLHKGRRASVYLAERQGDGRTVVLKVFDPNRLARTWAQRELEALLTFDHPGIVRALELLDNDSSPAIVLEHVPGITLREWVRSRLPDLPSAVRVAARLAEILDHLHERRFVHGDISPRNVMVDPATLETHLIDLGLARRLGSAASVDSSVSMGSVLEGTLEYLAPEQTGRMNRGCDLHSDLYAFGATLYFLVAGRPPFSTRDPLAMVHAHIARVPESPREWRREIPGPLCDIVLRLLEKEPEERYPGADVLQADLVTIAEHFETQGFVPEDLPLRGLQARRLVFSSEIHGRASEVERLESLYEVVATGEPRMALISGVAGMGKTSLVRALRRRTGATGGYLLHGKFDPYRPQPYSVWISVLKSLSEQLLLLNDADLERTRTELQAGLGDVAQALVDLVPDLSFVLGDVPPVPKLGPREMQERLALALGRAVRALATPERRLVLHLDDLHAGDPGSLLLLESLLTSRKSVGCFLIVGTYRPDEVPSDHLFAKLRARLEEHGTPLEEIQLGPLEHEATVALVAHALGRRAEDVHGLVQQVELKTGNSPFLIREFLEHLRAEGLLSMNGSVWEWHEDEIRKAAVPEGAVELVLARIERLDAYVVNVLRFSACVGDAFDVDLLVELGCGGRPEVEEGLFNLADAGLIVPAREGFRFAHDRIREAAQALLDPAQRESLHYQTGRALLSRTSEDQLPGRAALLAEHLNKGRRLLSEELRIPLVRVNLLAAENALASAALEEAARLLGIAKDLLCKEDWSSERQLFFTVHLRFADAEFLCNRFPRALETLAVAQNRELHVLELAQVESKRLLILSITESPDHTVRHALAVLRKWGFRVPYAPSKFRIWLEQRRAHRALRESRFGLDWQPAANMEPTMLASLMMLSSASGAWSRTNAALSAMMAYRAVWIYTRQGHVGFSGFTLAATAMSELTLGGDPKVARHAAEVALRLKEESADPVYPMRVEFVVHGLVYSWLMERRKALAPLADLADRALELGDPEFWVYTVLNRGTFLALAGEPVSAVEKIFQMLREAFFERTNPEAHLAASPMVAEACERIHGLLTASSGVEQQIDRVVEELAGPLGQMPTSNAVYPRTMLVQALCIFGRHEQAFGQSEEVRDDLFRVVPFVHVADHTFYRGLAAAALASSVKGRRRRALRAALRASARRLARWAQWGPDFAHMPVFLAAERARLRGDVTSAGSLYTQAARGAQQQGFVHHAALAHERRAELLVACRREREANSARNEAIALYRRWGCRAKADALQGH